MPLNTEKSTFLCKLQTSIQSSSLLSLLTKKTEKSPQSWNCKPLMTDTLKKENIFNILQQLIIKVKRNMYKQQKKFVTGANFPIFKVKPFYINQITWHQKYLSKKYISNLHWLRNLSFLNWNKAIQWVVFPYHSLKNKKGSFSRTP